ncbi:hypothetical protein XAC3337 [Xanthomonas citri pv. citri str. 306]|uniref:Uncharacterized protein n=1 Tax=Xanthomonas axonopodis pv. citri (strain 306) TaxID=190486 RepID=A0AAI7ZHK6_XANAC|nr:hypothetical protein XAC3337 [Xanthomonas citri pv. citri str. 306]
MLALSHRCCARLCTERLAHPGPWGEAWRAWRRTRVGSPGPPFLYRSGTSVEDGTPLRRAMPLQTVRDPGRRWFPCLRRAAGSPRSPLTRAFAWHVVSAAATSARRDGVAARSGLAADRCPNR